MTGIDLLAYQNADCLDVCPSDPDKATDAGICPPMYPMKKLLSRGPSQPSVKLYCMGIVVIATERSVRMLSERDLQPQSRLPGVGREGLGFEPALARVLNTRTQADPHNDEPALPKHWALSRSYRAGRRVEQQPIGWSLHAGHYRRVSPLGLA